MRLFPKRRWLRFSVRTLLLAVTILCVWLGWQVSIVRERKQLMHLIEEADGSYMALQPSDIVQNPARDISGIRSVMGDNGVGRILMDRKLSPTDRDRVEAAFPESNLWLYTGDGWQLIRNHRFPRMRIKASSK